MQRTIGFEASSAILQFWMALYMQATVLHAMQLGSSTLYWNVVYYIQILFPLLAYMQARYIYRLADMVIVSRQTVAMGLARNTAFSYKTLFARRT